MPKPHSADQYNACLPTRLRELLRERKITQSKLSSDVGILNQSISQYLDGSVTPPLEKLIKLADYFNVSIDYLIGRTEVASTSVKKKEICQVTGLTAKSVDILKKFKFNPDTETSMPTVLSIINTCIEIEEDSKNLKDIAIQFLEEVLKKDEAFLTLAKLTSIGYADMIREMAEKYSYGIAIEARGMERIAVRIKQGEDAEEILRKIETDSEFRDMIF